MASSFGVTSIG